MVDGFKSLGVLAAMLIQLANGGFGFAQQPNVLFIAVDDLRPELGCYGSVAVKSPNLDRLASEGLLFNRAYCQQAICGASRVSLLTGTRPNTTGVVHNYVDFREVAPGLVTLPQHFRDNGYETVFCGKIYHQKLTDAELSWSRKPAANLLRAQGIKPSKNRGGYADPKNVQAAKDRFAAAKQKFGDQTPWALSTGPAYESADVPDEAYVDGYNTRLAIATLQDHLENKPGQPLFLALGFYKPHLNWIAPKKYWDLYDVEQIRLASQVDAPLGGAVVGLHESFELRSRLGIPKDGPIGDELSKTLLHAYYACVSYVDAQVGLMIDALEEAGIRENTIIVLWGDHGWHLGEMGSWGKATNYEIATRVPLMIHAPKMKASGQQTRALVELIDIYPTLCELAGLQKPRHLDGISFVPLMDDPSLPWKAAAFSQFPSPALREWGSVPMYPQMREAVFGPLIGSVEEKIMAQHGDAWDRDLFENHLMGYAVRTDRHRLIEWRDGRNKTATSLYVELYDHQSDPDETTNVAAESPEVVRQLREQLMTYIGAP